MIEVIERGTPPAERTYEAKCNTCNSRIKFGRSDAKYTSDQRDGDFLTIPCPVCGSNVHKAAHQQVFT